MTGKTGDSDDEEDDMDEVGWTSAQVWQDANWPMTGFDVIQLWAAIEYYSSSVLARPTDPFNYLPFMKASVEL